MIRLLHAAVFMNAGSYVIMPNSSGLDLDLAQIGRADRAVLDRDLVLLAGAVVGNR